MLSDEEKIKQVLILSDEGNVLIYNVPQLTKPRHLVNDAREILQVKLHKRIYALHNIRYLKNVEIHHHLKEVFKTEIEFTGETYVPKGYFHIIDYRTLNTHFEFSQSVI